MLSLEEIKRVNNEAASKARAKQPVSLTASDWTEIYYAVEFKLNHSSAVEGDKRWQKQLEGIMRKIGPDGEKAAKQ